MKLDVALVVDENVTADRTKKRAPARLRQDPVDGFTLRVAPTSFANIHGQMVPADRGGLNENGYALVVGTISSSGEPHCQQ
jgi:hypothetical protein